MAEESKSADNNLEKALEQNEHLKQQIVGLENELTITNEQYQKVCIELHGQTESNDDHMEQLGVLQAKYDELSQQNTSTLDEIVNNEQTVTQLNVLQIQYDELVQDNKQTLEAMEELIMATHNKINTTRNECQQQIETLESEKTILHQSVTKITNESKILSQNLDSAMDKIKQYKMENEALNKQVLEKSILQQKYSQQKEKVSKIKQKYHSLQSKYEKLKKDNPMKQQLNEISNKYNESIGNMKKENQTLTQKLEKYTQHLKQYKADKKELNKKLLSESNEYQSLQIKYEQLQLEKQQKDKCNIETAEKQLNEMSQKYKQLLKENEAVHIKNQQLRSYKNNLSSNMMSLNNKNESNAIMVDKLKKNNKLLKQSNEKLSIKFEQVNQQKHEMEKKYEHIKLQMKQTEEKINEMENSHKESLVKYKEKAKNIVNKRRSAADKQMNEMKEKLERIINERNNMNEQYKQLLIQNQTNLSHSQSMKSISDLNTNLSKQIITLKQSNDALEIELKSNVNQLEIQTKICRKKEETLNKICKILSECILFKTNNDSMNNVNDLNIIECIDKLTQTYENVFNKQSKMEVKLKEKENKLKRLIKIRHECSKYYKSLQIIHCETRKALEKWKIIINETETDITDNDSNDISEFVIKDFRKLLKKKKSELKELENATSHIKKLTKKLNYCIKCIKENWHCDINKRDFVDLSVLIRLAFEDKIWCLIQWRKGNNTKKKRMKHHINDEYFWCSQAIYLKNLNVNENEIYLPDLFENKLEIQITKNLKLQKVQKELANEDELQQIQKEYKVKLNATMEETKRLKQKLSIIKMGNWQYKYNEIEKELSTQTIDVQNKKFQLSEIKNKLLSKEKEILIIKEQFENEKTEMNQNYAIKMQQILEEKENEIKLYKINNLTLDKETQTEYIAMEQYKLYNNDEQQTIEGVIVNNININNNNMTNMIQSKHNTKNNSDIAMDELKQNNKAMSTLNLAVMARMQADREQQIQIIHNRLLRLQQLLDESEEKHRKKDIVIKNLKNKLIGPIHHMHEIKNDSNDNISDSNTQYLKNALLQYFDGKININQLLSVVSVGLRFNENEQKKAQMSKLIAKQASKWW